jgi:hypothetical protein
MFVEMTFHIAGGARLVAAQIRFVLFGNDAKLRVTLRFVFGLMLVTSGITTVMLGHTAGGAA